MDDPRFVFWHSFEPGVASFGLAGVITEIGLAVFGADFAALQPDDRRRAVQNLLAEHRLLLIWDSFWTARSMPDPGGATSPLDEAGCQELLDFLETVAGLGRSAVLITSRTSQDWLGGIRRIAVGGLASHEAAGYAGKCLAPCPAAIRPRRARKVRRRTALEVTCPYVGGHLRHLPGGPAHATSHASHGSLVGRRHAGKQRCECGAVLVPVVLVELADRLDKRVDQQHALVLGDLHRDSSFGESGVGAGP